MGPQGLLPYPVAWKVEIDARYNQGYTLLEGDTYIQIKPGEM